MKKVVRPVDVVLTSPKTRVPLRLDENWAAPQGRDVCRCDQRREIHLINAIIQEITGDKDIITLPRDNTAQDWNPTDDDPNTTIHQNTIATRWSYYLTAKTPSMSS